MEDVLSEESLHVQEVLLAASCHDMDTLRKLINIYDFSDCKAVDVRDSETGFSPLHAAIAACETEEIDAANPLTSAEVNGTSANGMSPEEDLVEGAKETVKLLLEYGAIWNQLDQNDETPGCIAHRLRLEELYGLMVDAGVRAELLLNRLEGYQKLEDDDDAAKDDTEGIIEPQQQRSETNAEIDNDQDLTSAKYLSSTLSLSGDKLVDEDQNGVMMAWEAGIMSKSADAFLVKPGLRVLNIGFGMGIIDQYIQDHANKPDSHHIVEAHPDVLSQMKRDGWDTKPGVVIHEGKWQHVLPELVAKGLQFDAIFFDTFAESYADFRDFFSEQVIGLLDQDGKWSFFNGMGADRQINYDVYQKVVEMDLFEAGFDVHWQQIELPELRKEWEGVKRRYWDVDSYRLPVCYFMD